MTMPGAAVAVNTCRCGFHTLSTPVLGPDADKISPNETVAGTTCQTVVLGHLPRQREPHVAVIRFFGPAGSDTSLHRAIEAATEWASHILVFINTERDQSGAAASILARYPYGGGVSEKTQAQQRTCHVVPVEIRSDAAWGRGVQAIQDGVAIAKAISLGGGTVTFISTEIALRADHHRALIAELDGETVCVGAELSVHCFQPSKETNGHYLYANERQPRNTAAVYRIDDLPRRVLQSYIVQAARFERILKDLAEPIDNIRQSLVEYDTKRRQLSQVLEGALLPLTSGPDALFSGNHATSQLKVALNLLATELLRSKVPFKDMGLLGMEETVMIARAMVHRSRLAARRHRTESCGQDRESDDEPRRLAAKVVRLPSGPIAYDTSGWSEARMAQHNKKLDLFDGEHTVLRGFEYFMTLIAMTFVQRHRVVQPAPIRHVRGAQGVAQPSDSAAPVAINQTPTDIA